MIGSASFSAPLRFNFFRRRGFIVVELIVGLVVVALVMLALASVLFAVARGWDDQDIAQSTEVQANQIYARVQSYLSAAKCVAWYSTGPTSGAIIFWRADDDSDGQIEYGEVALIVQDPTTHSLYLYSSSLPYTGQAAAELSASDFAALTPAEIEGQSFMQQQLLGGPGAQPDNGTRIDVDGFQVYATQTVTAPTPFVTSQLPIVEFTLTLSKNGQSLTLYNSSTLRPSDQPQ